MRKNPSFIMKLSFIPSIVCNRLNIDSSVFHPKIVLDYSGQVSTFFFTTLIPLWLSHRKIRKTTACLLWISHVPAKPFSRHGDTLKRRQYKKFKSLNTYMYTLLSLLRNFSYSLHMGIHRSSFCSRGTSLHTLLLYPNILFQGARNIL